MVSCSMASDRGVNNPILSNFTTNSVFLFLNNKKYLKSPNNKRFLFLGLLTFAPAAALRECWFIGLLAKRPPHFCRNTFRNTQLQKYTKTNTQIQRHRYSGGVLVQRFACKTKNENKEIYHENCNRNDMMIVWMVMLI